MTFKQLVLKMAKVNKRKYIFYFLCNSFTVMIFFMFSTLFFNEKIIESPQMQHGMNELLMIPATALLIFTVFFISYAHSIFIKRRKKEFGLFMTLGMSYRDLVKLLLLENGAIALLSMIVGLFSGTVFSRLFFLIIMSNVELNEIPFYINVKMFLYTIGLFLLVFIVAVGKTLFVTKTHELVLILKGDRFSERNTKSNGYLGVIGVLITIVFTSILYLFTYETKWKLDQTIFRKMYDVDEGTYFILCTIGIIFGLHLTLSHFGSFFIQYAKKYPDFYNRRLLFLTNIDYKFKRFKSTFMLIIIMAMVTIFYSTVTLYFYSSAEQIADKMPYDIAFVETETKNKISLDELYSTLESEEHSISEHLLLETLDYFKPHEIVDYFYRYTFMSVENFNKISSMQLQVDEGNYVYFINSPINHPNSDYAEGIELQNDRSAWTLHLQQIVNEPLFDYRLRYYDQDFIVVNEDDFTLIKSKLDVHEATLHWLNVTNWKKTVDAVFELKETLQEINETTSQLDPTLFRRLSFYSEQELLEPVSKITEYNHNKKGSGIIFFVSTFLSILFFFATFILVYLNLFTDIEHDKKNYEKLYKIGITKKEVKRLIYKELSIIFFFAPIIGIVLAYVYIVTIAKDGGGITSNPALIGNFLTISSLYLFIQTIYYFIARKRYLREL